MIRKIIMAAAFVTLPILAHATPAQAGGGEFCREYSKTVSINGRPQYAYGTACRNRDGSWEVVNLGGHPKAQARVHDTIYADIEKEASKRKYRNSNIIVVDRYYDRGHRHAYKHHYKPYKKYSHYRGKKYGVHKHGKKHHRYHGYKHHRGDYFHHTRYGRNSGLFIKVDLDGDDHKVSLGHGKKHHSHYGHRYGQRYGHRH